MRAFTFVLLLLIVFFVLAIQDGIADQLAITCNRAVDSHCIYGPTALDRVNGTPPDLKLDSGTLFTKQVDGAGAYTFVVSDNAAGTFEVKCAFDGGDHWINFRFQQRLSRAVHSDNSSGFATIAFNDNPETHAYVGGYLTSRTPGVDMTLHCGCSERKCPPAA